MCVLGPIFVEGAGAGCLRAADSDFVIRAGGGGGRGGVQLSS